MRKYHPLLMILVLSVGVVPTEFRMIVYGAAVVPVVSDAYNTPQVKAIQGLRQIEKETDPEAWRNDCLFNPIPTIRSRPVMQPAQ